MTKREAIKAKRHVMAYYSLKRGALMVQKHDTGGWGIYIRTKKEVKPNGEHVYEAAL